MSNGMNEQLHSLEHIWSYHWWQQKKGPCEMWDDKGCMNKVIVKDIGKSGHQEYEWLYERGLIEIRKN